MLALIAQRFGKIRNSGLYHTRGGRVTNRRQHCFWGIQPRDIRAQTEMLQARRVKLSRDGQATPPLITPQRVRHCAIPFSARLTLIIALLRQRGLNFRNAIRHRSLLEGIGAPLPRSMLQ